MSMNEDKLEALREFAEKNSKVGEKVGKLAVHMQNTVDYTITMFYDEVIDLAQAVHWLSEELPKAKKHRDLFFGHFMGEQLPAVGYALNAEGEGEAYAAEEEVERFCKREGIWPYKIVDLIGFQKDFVQFQQDLLSDGMTTNVLEYMTVAIDAQWVVDKDLIRQFLKLHRITDEQIDQEFTYWSKFE